MLPLDIKFCEAVLRNNSIFKPKEQEVKLPEDINKNNPSSEVKKVGKS